MNPKSTVHNLLWRLRARMRGGVRERRLRQLMLRAPWPTQRLIVRFLPQPQQFEPVDEREVVIEGVRLKLFPYEFIQWVHYFGWPDPNFECLRCLSEDARCLIDIGANVGLYSLRCAVRAPGCRITAVEAHPKTFARLRSNAELNPLLRLDLVNVAIASEPGTVQLFNFENADSGLTSAIPRAGVRAQSVVAVNAITLDQLVTQRRLEPDLLKIDVEGFEPDVLAGGSDTLTRWKPTLVLEWTPEWNVGREQTVARAVDLLERLGYRAWRVPSPEQSTMVEVPLSALRAVDGAQLNLVVSCDRSTPSKLAGWVRRTFWR